MNADNTSNNKGAENKKNVAKTKVAKLMDTQGYATRELFVQFLVRISKEIPNATLAMFSKLKYVNAPNFEKFRKIGVQSILMDLLYTAKPLMVSRVIFQ